MDPLLTYIDVTDAMLGILPMAVHLYPPALPETTTPSIWSVWLPGATYRGPGYFDAVLSPSDTRFSMVRWLAEKGIGSLVLDTPGTGDNILSGVHGRLLTRERLTSWYVDLFTQLRHRLAAGTLSAEVPGPLEDLTLFAGGHSLGGSLLTGVEASFPLFDGIMLLGWCQGPSSWSDALMETLLTHEGMTEEHGYFQMQRPLLRPFFYGQGVAPEVIARDEANAVSLPSGIAPLDAQGHPAIPNTLLVSQICCPVFLSFGEQDIADNPYAEAQYYGGTHDLTCYVLEGAAHCTTFAPRRHELWDRLAAWMHTQAQSKTIQAAWEHQGRVWR